ncbi:amino acid adenylation domain-containing protein [Gynuella sp.]|uniref:amino acid adenylation domain-containing protein n=1 Tax=Gynuella sp. TaxID=2969146 RepID=UPI003D11E5B6
MNKKIPLSALRSELSAEQLALLESLKGKKNTTHKKSISVRTETIPVPLSFSQQRVWFLDQFVPDTPAYNIVMYFRSSGKLDATVLEKALNEIVRRHGSLRTSFQNDDGKAFQIVASELFLKLNIVDLTEYPEEQREAHFQKLIREESRFLFDLSKGPLLRVSLFLMAEHKQIIVTNAHHIIMDGTSIDIFSRELITLYAAFMDGQSSPLPSLPLQYTDFSFWQRDWLQGEVLESQLEYWRRNLSDYDNSFELPLDHTRPPIQVFQGDTVRFALSPKLVAAYRALGQQQDVTLFMLLLTALNILLYRYTGYEDVLVGTPIANRNRAELEGLIGFFANTLVLRTDLKGEPTFLELLERTRQVANGAYKHQDVPFELLVDELQPERNMSQNPLFQVCFAFFKFQPVYEGMKGKLNITLEESSTVNNNTSKFDLWISVSERDDLMDVEVEYNSVIFERDTVSRMMECYQVLLENIVADPEKKISEYSILPAEEKQKLLVDWNDTFVSYPNQGKCLHQLIEEQVKRDPDALAVIFEGMTLTYRELDAKAEKLAVYLQDLGVGPDKLVAVSVQRSLEMVIALVGILKAGGAYIPIDPDYPLARLSFMLADAQPEILLTQQSLLERLPSCEARIICLDSDWATIAKNSQTLSSVPVTEHHLAYMIYTSGSTGQPKGAMINHKSIRNRLDWMQQQYRLNGEDRVLQKTPFSFDVSVWEFFWPLISGASIILARPEGHKDPYYLASLIQQQNVTTLHFVPSMLQAFLEEPEIKNCQSIKRVFCSGEALPFSVQQRFFECLSSSQLHNLYGPTEAAIDVTYWACRRDDRSGRVPIGRPVANSRIYILDKHLNPVPVGVSGELHIGGVQVGRGYHNRPELTASRFIPDPFSSEPEAKLYKTGDLARFLADGSIEYKGRMDFQVKVRGFRIELGEIESTLEQHPAVREVAVLAKTIDKSEEHKHLIAYVVPRSLQLSLTDEDVIHTEQAAFSSSQISQWEQVFDKTYVEEEDGAGDFNVAGWNSSYTGLPLLKEEMRQWVDSTVERILDLRPRRVLEIGCGTGLLLSRIAPHCEEYWGTDISDTGLNYIREHLLGQIGPEKVKLLKRDASDFSGFDGVSFDVVVINSVVQYFPDIYYLNDVLTQAATVLTDLSAIFLGDIRHLGLLEMFHTDVELARGTTEQSIELLRKKVNKRLAQEQELVIDPEYFLVLQQSLQRISQVNIQLKQGSHHNELTRYRYDVVLHFGKHISTPSELSVSAWEDDKWNLETLQQKLSQNHPSLLKLTSIPNARLTDVSERLRMMAVVDEQSAIDQLSVISSYSGAVDPQDLYELGRQLGYRLEISWAQADVNGSYDALFIDESSVYNKQVWQWGGEIKQSASLETYANSPLLYKVSQQLSPLLKEFLKEKMPDYMVPSAYMILRKMPVDANGKLDRRALPLPVLDLPDLDQGFVEPETDEQKVLAAIWAEVLNLEKVGIHNNFFELGGDSIHSIQVVAKAKQKGFKLSPQHIFQHTTIAELVQALLLEKGASSLSDQKASMALFSERDLQVVNELLAQPDVEDVYPLAPFQEHMLHRYLQLRSPGLFLVHRIDVLPDPGEFDLSILRQAWQKMVARNPILRTSFRWQNLDEPLQVVHTHGEVKLHFADWRGLSEVEQEARLEDYLHYDRHRGIEPDQPNGLRYLIARIENAYLFVLGFSYLCLDGWSLDLISQEWHAIVDSLTSGRSLEARQRLPYRDFIQLTRSKDMSDAHAFWTKTLSGYGETTQLSVLSSNQSPWPEKGFARQFLRFSELLSVQLKTLARDRGLTLSTLIQGAWSLVLSYFSGKHDVVYGALMNGRSLDLEDVENMVGPTLNILPLRIAITPEAGLMRWLQGVLANIVELSRYENTPLRQIQCWSEIPTNQLLFESYLVFQNVGEESMDKAAGHFFVSKMGFPLRVDIFPQDNIAMHMSYYRDNFNDNTIATLMKSFHQVLSHMVNEPGCHVIDLLDSMKNISDSPEPRVFYEGRFRLQDMM